MKKFMREIFSFGFFSLFGLFIDIFIYSFLIKELRQEIFFASMASSSVAVTFVFFSTGYWSFKKQKVAFKGYFFWVIYQIIGIVIFSYFVSLFFMWDFSPLASKLLVLPLTFFANYTVARFLHKNLQSP
jgi:putative flippase GtrA